MARQNGSVEKEKSMESWIWDAACSLRGASDAPKYKDYILPLIFFKRFCDVFGDSKELSWDVIRGKTGEQVTLILRSVADKNPALKGIIDRIDYNASNHGLREIDDERLQRLIEKISEKRLGLQDVEPDIIGRSYEYLIRKFAEGSGQSAGEFYTPGEVGAIMARVMAPEPGMEVYDPTCGSGGLLIKCGEYGGKSLKLYGQEFTPATWAMSKMNMVIHDMEGHIEIGDTMNHPKFLRGEALMQFDRVVANPMWNQPDFGEKVYLNDPYGRFGFGIPPSGNADWGWIQHIFSSLKDDGKAAVVFDTNAASRGSNVKTLIREKAIRAAFLDRGYIEAVLLLPENLFYNTAAPGVIFFFTKKECKDILFVNASKEFVKGSPKNYISSAGIDKIVETIQTRKEVEGFSVLLGISAIKDIDYDLSPQRHIPVDAAMPDWDLDHLRKEIESTRAKIEELHAVTESYLGKIGNLLRSEPLPEGWASCSFKSLLLEDFSGEWGREVPGRGLARVAVIRGTDIPDVRLGRVSGCPYRYIKEAVLERKRVREGDIVTEISGGGKHQHTGRVLYIDRALMDANPPLLFSNFTKLLRFDGSVVLPKYVYYYWEYLYLIGRIARYEKQPTSIKNFKLDDFLASERICYPRSREKQWEICRVLDGVIGEQLAIKGLANELIAMQFTLFRDLLNGQRILDSRF
ncbi:MAG: SAM-dependent DNA methyltransferase [Bacteroidetes bacterium]|nr:SAM-dependent DNA methyltransferase [Bacteroidota bacterium]